ncbi:MAG: hypothetical protein VB877_13140, partial [Pirellulaceae bacterium]
MGQRRNKRRRSLRRRSAKRGFARHYDQGGYQRSLFHELLEERRLLATDWLQLGADLDGEKAGDWAGNTTSLSADGLTLAIGAPRNDGLNGADSGHIRIYRYNSTDQKWNPFGAEIDGEAAGDESGTSVSLSADGNIVAIGAPHNNGAGGTDSGHTRIYRYNPASQQWALFGAEIDGTATDENFGTSVSMNAEGSIVAVGAPGVAAGHTRIYAYNLSGNSWDLLGNEIVGEAAGDESGTAVSLSDAGNTVAIGAPKNSNVGSFSGHTRIYQYDSNASDWLQLGIDLDGENTIDMSGGAVALSGDGLTVAVGAILNTGNGSAAGHTRLHRYDTGAWNQLGPDIDAEKAGDASGASVSLSTDGNTVAVGAWGNDGANGENSGHVRVFEYLASDNSWLAVGTDIDGETAGDEAGSSVSLSSDGNTIAIGAISNLGSGSVSAGASGHTRIYRWNLSPPIANSDTYGVNEDLSLVVDVAEGVLANDDALCSSRSVEEALLDPAEFASRPFPTDPGTYTFDTSYSTGVPTLTGPNTFITGVISDNTAVFTFDSIHVGDGMILNGGSGERTLALLSTSDIVVSGNGTIDIKGGNGELGSPNGSSNGGENGVGAGDGGKGGYGGSGSGAGGPG